MKKFAVLIVFVLAVSFAHGQPDPDADVPVAPIAPSSIENWTNVFKLRNPVLEIVTAPCLGRIIKISYKGGGNLLRLNARPKDRASNSKRNELWQDYGGNWISPMAQSQWAWIAKSNGAPLILPADKSWTGTAWKDADGTSCCQLSREYGKPICVKVNRLIKLDKEAARFTIRQRIERTSPSELPVALCTISQIIGANRIVIPREQNSLFEKGVTSLLSAVPDDKSLTSCRSALVYNVYNVTNGEHKLCSNSKRSWIAAQKGDVVITERVSSEIPEGVRPGGECTVAMDSSARLGYSEIGTLGVEKKLLPGESLQNTITIELLQADAGLSACELADFIGKTFGEMPEYQPPANSPAAEKTPAASRM